jgi:hypothetical protein
LSSRVAPGASPVQLLADTSLDTRRRPRLRQPPCAALVPRLDRWSRVERASRPAPLSCLDSTAGRVSSEPESSRWDGQRTSLGTRAAQGGWRRRGLRRLTFDNVKWRQAAAALDCCSSLTGRAGAPFATTLRRCISSFNCPAQTLLSFRSRRITSQSLGSGCHRMSCLFS